MHASRLAKSLITGLQWFAPVRRYSKTHPSPYISEASLVSPVSCSGAWQSYCCPHVWVLGEALASQLIHALLWLSTSAALLNPTRLTAPLAWPPSNIICSQWHHVQPDQCITQKLPICLKRQYALPNVCCMMYDIIAQHHTAGYVRPVAKFDVCQQASIIQQTLAV